MAKEGYTKSGKSLKAVRRYYALQNEAKREAERAKAATEDKLSKRIAAELKTHQEANQKRLQSPTGEPATSPPTIQGGQIIGAEMKPSNMNEAPPTERSGLPDGVVMSPKQTGGGPVFMPAEAVARKSAKSVKSAKSTRSATGTGYRYIEGDRYSGISQFENYSLGCLIGLACVFLAAFLYTFVDKLDTRRTAMLEIDFEVKWLGYTSIFVLLAAIYWVYKRNQFFHAILGLIVLILSCVSSVILLATSRHYKTPVEAGKKSVFDMDVHIVFFAIIGYFISQLLVIALMILHIIGLLSRQITERSVRTDYQEGGLSHMMGPTTQ